MQTIMIVEDDPDIRDGVRIALDCNRVWVDEQEADLTETEYKILKLLMQSPQRIFPVQVIYETVWGEPYFYVSNGTVMVHIRNLRQQQLDKEHRSEAAALCSGALFFCAILHLQQSDESCPACQRLSPWESWREAPERVS